MTNNILLKTKYRSEDNENSSDIFLLLNYSHYLSTFNTINKGIYENARFSTINKLNFNDPYIQKIHRAGIIYFSFIDGELHLCFGRDKKSGDITDFSGLKKKFETPIECALREGCEESRRVFGYINPDQVSKYVCLYSTQMLIIFVPVIAPTGIDIRKLTSENFNNKNFLNSRQLTNPCYNEISELLWFGESEISNIFSLKSNHKMYTKVRRFIYSCRPFSENIEQMKKILGNGLITQEVYELYESQFRNHCSRNRKKEFPRKRRCFLRTSGNGSSSETVTAPPQEEKITIPDFSDQILKQ